MRFFETVLAGAALVAAAFAVEINDFPSNPEVGKTYTITYSPKDNTPTTLILRKGDSTNLDTVATLTTTATGGSFQWTVDTALPNGQNYALTIRQQGQPDNYSKQFPISGSNASPSASASASASASSASSASASAASSLSSALSSAISSALSSASSAASAASTLTTSASASISSSVGTNTTISSATLSASKSGATTTAKATGSSTSTGGAPANTGAAAVLGSSPLALIFGAVAAMAYVN